MAKQRLGLNALARAATAITNKPGRRARTHRHGIVGVVDYVAMTAQVSIGGSANLVTARWLGPYIPVYLDGVRLLLSAGEPLILGPVGKARPLGAHAQRTINQTITNTSWQSITFDLVDLTRMPTTITSTHRAYRNSFPYRNNATYRGLTSSSPPAPGITFPIAGRWLAVLNVQWDTNATGNRFARFLQNGATSIGGTSGPATINTHGHLQPTLTRELIVGAAGDYLEAQIWQDSGASRTIATADLTLTYLGLY